MNFNKSIWPIDENLIGTTTPAQSGHMSNGNKEVLHILQMTMTEASLSNAI